MAVNERSTSLKKEVYPPIGGSGKVKITRESRVAMAAEAGRRYVSGEITEGALELVDALNGAEDSTQADIRAAFKKALRSNPIRLSDPDTSTIIGSLSDEEE